MLSSFIIQIVSQDATKKQTLNMNIKSHAILKSR